jgi:hypothetical protein
MCGAKHAAAEMAPKKMTDRQCVEACQEWREMVFAVDDKVFKIANQDFDDLSCAGHEVTLTGELKGDTITVAKIEMPKK